MIKINWLNHEFVKKNTEAQLDSSKDVDLEVNAEKSKLMFLSPHHNAE
jgi:hypothetical protein